MCERKITREREISYFFLEQWWPMLYLEHKLLHMKLLRLGLFEVSEDYCYCNIYEFFKFLWYKKILLEEKFLLSKKLLIGHSFHSRGYEISVNLNACIMMLYLNPAMAMSMSILYVWVYVGVYELVL